MPLRLKLTQMIEPLDEAGLLEEESEEAEEG
jgi:hypothetical protein